jgi:hypothetical protein
MTNGFVLLLTLAVAAFSLAGCFAYSERPPPPSSVVVIPPANPSTQSGTVVVPHNPGY